MAFTNVDTSIQYLMNASGSTGLCMNSLLSAVFLVLTCLKMREWYGSAAENEALDAFSRKVDELMKRQELEDQLALAASERGFAGPETIRNSSPSPELSHRHSIPMLVSEEEIPEQSLLLPSKPSVIELVVTEKQKPTFGFTDIHKLPLSFPATVTVSEVEAFEA